jgi:hypothetical protein
MSRSAIIEIRRRPSAPTNHLTRASPASDTVLARRSATRYDQHRLGQALRLRSPQPTRTCVSKRATTTRPSDSPPRQRAPQPCRSATDQTPDAAGTGVLPMHAAEVLLRSVDDDRVGLDAFVRLCAVLGDTQVPARIAMFPAGSWRHRIDVTDKWGPELNALRNDVTVDPSPIALTALSPPVPATSNRPLLQAKHLPPRSTETCRLPRLR